MMRPTSSHHRARGAALAALIGLFAVFALSLPATAVSNQGTVKVHDNAVADPPTQNEPHVSCDFWVEGFNMERANGTLVFQAWPPTGNGTVVVPTGDDLNWTANATGHFLNGAYQLPAGHYKVTAESIDDKDKSKVFWVDPCVTQTTTTPPETTTTVPATSNTTSPPPTTEIPVFPTASAVAVGAIGALGSAFLVMRRRK